MAPSRLSPVRVGSLPGALGIVPSRHGQPTTTARLGLPTIWPTAAGSANRAQNTVAARCGGRQSENFKPATGVRGGHRFDPVGRQRPDHRLAFGKPRGGREAERQVVHPTAHSTPRFVCGSVPRQWPTRLRPVSVVGGVESGSMCCTPPKRSYCVNETPCSTPGATARHFLPSLNWVRSCLSAVSTNLSPLPSATRALITS